MFHKDFQRVNRPFKPWPPASFLPLITNILIYLYYILLRSHVSEYFVKEINTFCTIQEEITELLRTVYNIPQINHI